MTKKYRVFERVQLALLVSFISGFINAYTYNTQGGRFAGVQTGNMFMMMIYAVQKDFGRLFSYAIPVIFFFLGQFLAYFLREFARQRQYRWHAFSAQILFILMLVTAIVSPYVGENVTIALLALFASVQLETFKRIHHMAYANIMMTGNLKNAAVALVRGLVEKNERFLRQFYGLFGVMLSFMVGVVISTLLSPYLYEQTLYLLLLPLLVINYWLITEKPSS